MINLNNKNFIFNIILLLFALCIVNIYISILKKDDLFPFIISIWILFCSYILRYKQKKILSATAGIIYVALITVAHLISYVFPEIFDEYSFISIIYITLLCASLFFIFYGLYKDFKSR
jgi:hypothetical protein